VRTVRNIAIIALVALGVAALPGGGNAANVVLTALTMGFLVAIGFFAWRLYMENQLTISTLSDMRRGILYGALGVIGLLIAGADELFSTGGGTAAWLSLLVISVLAIFWVWREATTYT
jgi:TRAP-type C4-dicarboxylate transport system permease small subunit